MKKISFMSLRTTKWRSTLPFNGIRLSRRINRLIGDCFVAKERLLATTFLTMTIVLTACLPLQGALPTDTPTPTDATIPTGTIVWFPPTATPTRLVFPTYTGTPEMKPGIGAEIVTDDLSDEAVWDTAASEDGSASVNRNRLTIAVQPGVYLLSQRHDLTLGNFYAEITANLSLCRGEDTYGVIVRSIGRSYYRFALSCNGLAHAERVNTRGLLPLHEPIPSGDIPHGAPGTVTIGVWAVGSELRLFLNGRYQFGFSDTSYASGAFGVYALSQGTDPVSVTFTDLKVYEVDYTLPTPTPKPPTQTPNPK